jgi:hypothetical protein
LIAASAGLQQRNLPAAGGVAPADPRQAGMTDAALPQICSQISSQM